MTWPQVYTPLGDSLFLSTLAAAVPVVLLLGLLAFGRVRADLAALAGLAAALVVAVGVYGMPPRLAGCRRSTGRLTGCSRSAGSCYRRSSSTT